MKTAGKIITAASAGVAAGAALGILFAPDKGIETRKKINAQGKKLANGAKDKLNKSKEKFNGLKEDVEKMIKDNVEAFI